MFRFCSGVTGTRYICLGTGCMGPLPPKDSSSAYLIDASDSSEIILGSNKNACLQDPHTPTKKTSFKRGEKLSVSEHDKLFNWTTVNNQIHPKISEVAKQMDEKPSVRSTKQKPVKCTVKTTTIVPLCNSCNERKHDNRSARDDCKAFSRQKHHHWSAVHVKLQTQTEDSMLNRSQKTVSESSVSKMSINHADDSKFPKAVISKSACSHYFPPQSDALTNQLENPFHHPPTPCCKKGEVSSNQSSRKTDLACPLGFLKSGLGENVLNSDEAKQASNVRDLKARLTLARLVPGLEGSAVPPTSLQLWMVEQTEDTSNTTTTINTTTTTVVSSRSIINLSNCRVPEPGLAFPTPSQVAVMSQRERDLVAAGSSSASKCTYTKEGQTFVIKLPGQSHDTTRSSAPRTVQLGLPITLVPPVATTVMSGRQIVRLSTPNHGMSRCSEGNPTMQAVASPLIVKQGIQTFNVNTTGNLKEQRKILSANQSSPITSVARRVYAVNRHNSMGLNCNPLPSIKSDTAHQPIGTFTTVSSSQPGLVTVNSSRPVLTSSNVISPGPSSFVGCRQDISSPALTIPVTMFPKF